MDKFLLHFAVVLLTSCSGDSNQIVTLSAEEFVKRFKQEPGVIIDVRTPGEWQRGWIKGALTMDVSSGNFQREYKDLNKETVYYLYCHSGGRSAAAARMMKESGFKRVFNIRDGVQQLNALGMPLEFP